MKPRQIHQILPFLAYGDAIGNQVLEIRRLLREWGYASEIFAENWDPRLAQDCLPHTAYARYSHPDNLLILHYSIGGEVNRLVLSVPDRSVIYYHNITPPHFFYWVNGQMARQLFEARRDLGLLAGKIPAIAASPFNARELEGMGFRVLGVAPYVLNFEKLDRGLQTSGAQALARKFVQPNVRSWLYVGRLVPNKCVEDAIKAFYFYHKWICPQSRLLLVGTGAGMDPYVESLQRLTHRLELDAAVVFAGHYGAADGLATFYQMADVYISMSEHEGFCIPLVEAMYYGLPVIAHASTGVPFTLDQAGLLIHKKNHAVIAEAAHEVTTNATLRARIISTQHARVDALAPDVARAQLRACVEMANKENSQ
jgi:L-malate glycosyltransferase